MECPFNDLEFADLSILDPGAAVQIEQIQSIIHLVQRQESDDPTLYPALSVAIKLLSALEAFLGGVEARRDQLEAEYDKRRALAEACRPAKALSEDQGSTHTQKPK